MNSKKASEIVGNMWDEILIANWFDKEWFEDTFNIKLTEEEYHEIVELYNDSNMFDIITREIEEWIIDNNILEQIIKKR